MEKKPYPGGDLKAIPLPYLPSQEVPRRKAIEKNCVTRKYVIHFYM